MADKERRLEEHEKINVPYWVSLVRWFKVGCMPTEGQAIVYVSSNKKVGVITNVSIKRWDWYSQTQPMRIRHNRAAKPLDTACSKYLKRHRRGK